MNETNAYLAGKTICKTSPLYQYDYGQILKIIGIELPEAYEVHFSNQLHGTATTQIGNVDGVTIPDIYLTTGYPVYAWIYLHTGESDGETEYQITIPVIQRASISNATPTPVQQDAITEAIAALNAAVTDAETAIEHYPKIEGGVWYVWDVDSGAYVSTGISATGPAGQDGAPGQDGEDGFSPTVSITDITNGHRVTVTDANGQHTFDVMNGEDGQDGAPGADGYSPTVTVTDITGGHTVTITDKNGEHSFNVMDGETPTVPVTDVQVNGTSVVTGGVANIQLNPVETVSGSTPSITAMAGVRYVCGEVSTLAVTVPASGCVDIVFESGSTATVLTVTSQKTGVTAIKWANGFDPTALDANTVYEINILDGEYGVVGSWT